jgi:membrane protein YdbS with pleckstrin-like domain
MEKVILPLAVVLFLLNCIGELIHIEKTANNDTWLAATTSLGLLGVIARIKISVLADYKVWANQTTLDEADVLNGDLFELISPYVTANFWVCPSSVIGPLRLFLFLS